MRYVLGIDPGRAGAMCLLDENGSSIGFWEMPTTGGKVCPLGVINLYRRINEICAGNVHVFIEQVITIASDCMSVQQWQSMVEVRRRALKVASAWREHEKGANLPKNDWAALFRDLGASVEDSSFVDNPRFNYRVDGRKGVLTMSKAAGYLWAGLHFGWRIEEVHPKTWQAVQHRGCDGKTAKDRSLIAFTRKFPDLMEAVTPGKRRKPHDGFVDAALVADWALNHACGFL